ncbi:hypothetical protein PAECIP111894_02811 [Paenibacillus pseudetheri]|uniref:Uncharacterized protein n=1 Tax=Paenibacillus pseudetheri TaxID=2897682 RepID=A0ABM9BD21_9BACL|nr:hypothetical protein PAECIP111894_02811 [Paenibacillus pseudetheri]
MKYFRNSWPSRPLHQVTSEITKDMKSEAIHLFNIKILEYIAVSQPVTTSEISECMLMSMPNTSRELRKLSEKQLCEKINTLYLFCRYFMFSYNQT